MCVDSNVSVLRFVRLGGEGEGEQVKSKTSKPFFSLMGILVAGEGDSVRSKISTLLSSCLIGVLKAGEGECVKSRTSTSLFSSFVSTLVVSLFLKASITMSDVICQIG